MIRPDSMTFTEVVCTDDALTGIIDILQHSGMAEMEDSTAITDQPVSRHIFSKNDIETASILKTRIENALDFLDVSYTASDTSVVLLSETLQYTSGIEGRVNEIIETFTSVKSIGTDIANESLKRDFFTWITSLGIDPALCHSDSYITVITGVIITNEVPSLISGTDTIIILSELSHGHVFIVTASASNTDLMQQIIKYGEFVPVDCASLPRDIAALAQIRIGLLDMINTYTSVIPDIQRAYSAIDTYISASAQIAQCVDTRYCTHIACWIPSASAHDIINTINNLFGNNCSVRMIKAETAIAEKVFSYETVPSRLGNSLFLNPFRILVSSYSWPAYRHIDPTPFSALFFLLFFGMMFADAGHGACIAMIGIIIRILTSGKAIRSAGMLMIYSGIAAAVGGFLFGSVFGREDIISPLLFHPDTHISAFLSIGIGIGILVISTGIILNIIQTIWKRNHADAVFSQWGIFSLVFYWLCAYIITASFSTTLPEPPLPVIILTVSLPLISMMAGDLIVSIRRGHADISEIMFRPVEIMLGLLSNTVSFVRIAAFGLCHIALMSAVYIIASAQPDSPSYFISVSIEGNIFVILLEALIVSIQCVRLQFYEFYSKFFSTSGRRFIPIGTTSDTGDKP